MKQLYTRWGKELDCEHVLQEYPRPLLQRDSYINLNGYERVPQAAALRRQDPGALFTGKRLIRRQPAAATR